jgi:hypothetical protein
MKVLGSGDISKLPIYRAEGCILMHISHVRTRALLVYLPTGTNFMAERPVSDEDAFKTYFLHVMRGGKGYFSNALTSQDLILWMMQDWKTDDVVIFHPPKVTT